MQTCKIFVLFCVPLDKFSLAHMQSKFFLVFCAISTGHKSCFNSPEDGEHSSLSLSQYQFRWTHNGNDRKFTCFLLTVDSLSVLYQQILYLIFSEIYIQQWEERLDIFSFLWFHRELVSFLDDFQLHTKYCLITCKGNRNYKLKHCL